MMQKNENINLKTNSSSGSTNIKTVLMISGILTFSTLTQSTIIYSDNTIKINENKDSSNTYLEKKYGINSNNNYLKETLIDSDNMNIHINISYDGNGISIFDRSIIEDSLEKEKETMEQLIAHRDKIEKVGIVSGMSLGTITLIPSMLSMIEWAATIPASILFFSVPLLILLRKKTRGDYN